MLAAYSKNVPESFPRGVYWIYYKGSELAKSFIVFYCATAFSPYI